jgi:hypothetical protein
MNNFELNLLKSRPHKYLKKYKKGDKWIYIYNYGENKGKQVPEEAIEKIKRLIELRHQESKRLLEEAEEIEAPKDSDQDADKKPDAPKKTRGRKKKEDSKTKTSEPKATEASESSKSKAAESPRDAADTSENIIYEWARPSEISNMGSDVFGAARHLRNRWRGLAAAEEEGVAEDVINLKGLLEVEPVDFFSKINEANFLSVLVSYWSLNKFPKNVVYSERFNNLDDDAEVYKYFQSDGRFYYSKIEIPTSSDRFEKVKVGDEKKRYRKEYFDEYKKFSSFINNLDHSSVVDPKEIIKKIAEFAAARYADKSLSYQMREGYRLLHNSVISDGQNGVRGKLVEFGKKTASMIAPASASMDEKVKSAKKIAEAAKLILEGKSMNKALGIESSSGERVKRWDAQEVYLDGVEIEGPNYVVESRINVVKDGEAKVEIKYSDNKKVQYMAYQFGNSMTEAEREHHRANFERSMRDLCDALDLPPEMGSFNGRLAIAFGARGKAGAKAHYEPKKRIINLTRASGVGSLAHEWGHFFDNILNGFFGSNRGGFSSASYIPFQDKEENQKLASAIRELTKEFQNIKTRMRQDKDIQEMLSMGLIDPRYWFSAEEIWARAFERHVQKKLDEKGRKNTYLVALKKSAHPLWPNDEEVERLKPLWDNLFNAFKEGGFVSKAMMFFIEKDKDTPKYYIDLKKIER